MQESESKVQIFFKHDGNDRDEYNELLEDMLYEKLRQLWIEHNLDCNIEDESTEIIEKYFGDAKHLNYKLNKDGNEEEEDPYEI